MDAASVYEVKKLKSYARDMISKGFSLQEIRPMIVLKLTKTSLASGSSGVPTGRIADFILQNL